MGEQHVVLPDYLKLKEVHVQDEKGRLVGRRPLVLAQWNDFWLPVDLETGAITTETDAYLVGRGSIVGHRLTDGDLEVARQIVQQYQDQAQR